MYSLKQIRSGQKVQITSIDEIHGIHLFLQDLIAVYKMFHEVSTVYNYGTFKPYIQSRSIMNVLLYKICTYQLATIEP